MNNLAIRIIPVTGGTVVSNPVYAYQLIDRQTYRTIRQLTEWDATHLLREGVPAIRIHQVVLP
jgi:hypothetical protein